MKVKRYTAASMRQALDLVRIEQGPDAVILSSRRSEEGIEVIAAVDYDETLMAAAAPRPAVAVAPPPAAAPQPAATPTPKSTPKPAATARPTAPVATAPVAPDRAYVDMQKELKSLRQLLEHELASLTWSDKRLREPLKVRVLEDLSALDIAPDVARALAALTPRATRLRDPANIPLALLARHLPVVDDKTCEEGGIVALVGPTGVGKTTTIAKLAARWTLRHGIEDLALVSTDGYRIGAREQLMTFARILGVPLYSANTGPELAAVLARLKSKKLVLIDTAGIGPRDARLADHVRALQQGASLARVMLVLPAQGEAHALEQITVAFKALAPCACILTKVDEAASLGAAMSTAVRHRLPIAYLCNGPRVPQDLHQAHPRRIWLVRAAQRFKERTQPGRDPSYFEQNFGRRVPNHA